MTGYLPPDDNCYLCQGKGHIPLSGPEGEGGFVVTHPCQCTRQRAVDCAGCVGLRRRVEQLEKTAEWHAIGGLVLSLVVMSISLFFLR